MKHPILLVLAEQGRSTAWLARRIERNRNYLTQVFNGHSPASMPLRAACARVLEVPESLLFHSNGSSADQRGGTPETGSGEPPAYAHDAAGPIRATA